MRLCVVVALLWWGCGGDRRVPQHEERDEHEVETVDGFEPERSQPVEPGAAVSVEGAPLATQGQVRALLTLDLDDDGDRDGLAVEAHEGSVVVHIAHRDEGTFRARRVGALTLDEGCELDTAEIETVSSEHAFARATITCEDADDWRAWWVLSVGAAPRLHETLSLRGEGSVSLELVDHDDDNHLDLAAQVDVGNGPLTLRWFDRPSGLAREDGEPANTLEALVQEDRERATALIGALCRGTQPRFRLGRGEWGIACPDTLTRRARDASTIALLQSGQLRQAVAVLPEQIEGALEAALNTAATTVVSQRIAPWSEPSNATTRHVMLAFEGNDLIVRGVEAQLYSAAAPDNPVPAEAHPAPIADSQDAFFVQSVHRDCRGLELRVLPRSQLRAAAFAAPRAVRAFEDPIEDCTEAPADSWRALGWAPQGVVVASLSQRRTVPLTVEALPLGDALDLADGALPPAPLKGGRITPDGSVWIWETPHGVLRMGENTELWRTNEWQTAPVDAAAISSDGTAIAILQRGAVSVLRREAAQ